MRRVQGSRSRLGAQRSEQNDKKRGATHQDNQQSSSVGVGPGQNGSFGAAIVETSSAAWKQRAAGLGELVEREQQQQQQQQQW